jgi:hypothetical protein
VLLGCGVSAGTYKARKIRPRPSTFLINVGPLMLLMLNGQNISFVNHVKYLGVIFDKKIT